MVIAIDDGFGFIAFAENSIVGVAIEAIEHGGLAVFVAVVEVGVVGGEAFVEPEMAPVFAGDVIAEPLMGQFVGDEFLAGTDVLGVLGKEGASVEDGEGGVFHTAGGEVVHDDLVILIPGAGRLRGIRKL